MCVMQRNKLFETKEIKLRCRDIKIEIFIHDTMHISYSGRFSISAFITSRNTNQEIYAHSCRWKYKNKFLLKEELKSDKYLEI
ncbi:MAG: hypothetical protein Nk1A_4300 [Endomicrobiia bacterium]|nr:MAG: hypothetical protein Nk1A_4300 [Endomicrobiia bacterium]